MTVTVCRVCGYDPAGCECECLCGDCGDCIREMGHADAEANREADDDR